MSWTVGRRRRSRASRRCGLPCSRVRPITTGRRAHARHRLRDVLPVRHRRRLDTPCDSAAKLWISRHSHTFAVRGLSRRSRANPVRIVFLLTLGLVVFVIAAPAANWSSATPIAIEGIALIVAVGRSEPGCGALELSCRNRLTYVCVPRSRLPRERWRGARTLWIIDPPVTGMGRVAPGISPLQRCCGDSVDGHLLVIGTRGRSR
jgi:hypothetical protein